MRWAASMLSRIRSWRWSSTFTIGPRAYRHSKRMKMMNAIEAGMSGTVVEVCAENAQLVKDGEPLFRVSPA